MRALLPAAVLPAVVLVSCGGPPPTLTRVQTEVFAKSCNFTSCHTGAGAEGLSLEMQTHAKIVNVKARAVGATDLTLVVPSKPEESYLYQKMIQAQPKAGARMPPTGEPLDAARVGLVRDWIAAGAQNN